MGDIKLQVGTHEKLRALINDSRHQIDVFASKWGDLANRIPRTNLLQPFDDLTNILTSVDAEVKCRKYAGLHGYENLTVGKLNFEEAHGIISKSANYSYNQNMNLAQNTAHYANNVSYGIIQKGSNQLNMQGSNYYNNAYVQQGNVHVMTPGATYVNESNMVQHGDHLMTSSQNSLNQKINRVIEQ